MDWVKIAEIMMMKDLNISLALVDQCTLLSHQHIENYHHFIAEIRSRAIPVLADYIKQAQDQYNANLHSYVELLVKTKFKTLIVSCLFTPIHLLFSPSLMDWILYCRLCLLLQSNFNNLILSKLY